MVLWFTFITEALGTLVLFLRFSMDFPPGAALYHAVYNAISAFNNCGYSLFSDNLMGYQGDVIVNLTIMGLIVHGGSVLSCSTNCSPGSRGTKKTIGSHENRAHQHHPPHSLRGFFILSV